MTAAAVLLRFMNSNRCLNNNNSAPSSRHCSVPLIKFAVNNNSEVNNASTYNLCRRKDRDTGGVTSGSIDQGMDCCDRGLCVLGGQYAINSDLECTAEADGGPLPVKEMDTGTMPHGAVRVTRKRPSPFGSEMSPSPAKWMSLESHKGPDDVIITAYDMADRRAELGDSSGIPSPVDEDKTNDSVDQDMYVESFETPGHNYFNMCQSESSFSSPSQNDAYNIFDSICSFANTPKEMHYKRCTTVFENEESRMELSNCLLQQLSKQTEEESEPKDDKFSFYSEKKTFDAPRSGCTMKRGGRNGRTLSMDMNIIYKNSKKLLKTVKGFMLVLNEDLVIDFVSENVIDYLGFHHNEMTGQPLSSFIHPSYLSVLDYTRSKICHRGDCRPLDRCHFIPIQLRHGQDKNSCYRTVHWHVGFMRSRTLVTRSHGSVDGDQNVIVSVCMPASTPYSLTPCRLELTTLGCPRHWTFYSAGEKWLLFPFGVDFQRTRFEIASVTEIIQHLAYDTSIVQSRCPFHKSSQFDYVAAIACPSHPNTEMFVVKLCSCNRCSHRLKNTKSCLCRSVHSSSSRQLTLSDNHWCRKNISTHKNKHRHQNQPHKMFCQLHQTSKPSSPRGMLHCFLLCLQRNSALCSARRRVSDKHGVNVNQENIKETRLKLHSTCSRIFTDKTEVKSQELSKIESSIICPMRNQFGTKINSSRFDVSSYWTKGEVFGEKVANCYSPELISIELQTDSDASQIVKDCHQEFTEEINSNISESSQPSQQIERHNQHRKQPEENSVSTPCGLSHSIKRQENQKESSSSVDEAFGVVGLEDIDLTTEFSFHTGSCDIVMPVENEFNCVGDDMVLNNSSSSSSGITSNFSNLSEHNTDPYASQAPHEFSYSLDEEFQGDGFQTFDHILNFPPSDMTPATGDNYNYFKNSSCDVNAELDNGDDCSNKMLMEMNDIAPENKNLSQSFHHSLLPLLKSCDNPSETSLNSAQRKANGKSLLRSLLNKNEEKAAAAVVVTARHERPTPYDKPSRHLNGFESHMLLKNTMQTKELPVPRSHFSKKRRWSMPTPTQELPLPGSALKNAFNSILSPTMTSGSPAMCKNNLANVLNGDEILSNVKQHEGGFTDLKTDVVEGSMNSISDNGDTLPDDLVDLAMEYCNSLDSKQAEYLITDLSEQFGWIENMDMTTETCPTHNLKQTLHPSEMSSTSYGPSLNVEAQYSQKKTTEITNHHGPSSTSVCLPLSNNLAARASRQSPSASGSLNPSSPSSTIANKSNHISLLRQAVTSPDVDKLIEKIPLGRNILSEKHKSCDKDSSSHIYKTKHPDDFNRLIDSGAQNILNALCSQNTATNRQSSMEHRTVKHTIRNRQSISNFNVSNRHDKTTAVSHISISAPPNSSKHISPIKLKIPASSEVTNRRRSNSFKNSSVCSLTSPTKSSTCPNSSSNGVSVMVMRKENHRSRKSKTVATQTDNHPDEVYPALELSISDVIVTPSLYLDTSTVTKHTTQPIKSPPIAPLNKSTSHSCNVFSSSLRSLVSPRDSKELTSTLSPSPSQASPSPSTSSTSSISELELHLRGWSGPDSSSSSPVSSETSDTSSEVPFLQRLLTGELSKDRYEKLDKNLLEKQRSSLASKLSSS